MKGRKNGNVRHGPKIRAQAGDSSCGLYKRKVTKKAPQGRNVLIMSTARPRALADRRVNLHRDGFTHASDRVNPGASGDGSGNG